MKLFSAYLLQLFLGDMGSALKSICFNVQAIVIIPGILLIIVCCMRAHVLACLCAIYKHLLSREYRIGHC